MPIFKMIIVSAIVSMGMASSNLRSLMESSGDGIPVFSVNTSGTIVDEPKVSGKFSISSGGEISVSGHLGIEFRGSSSQEFPKKSYGFETRDEENSDVDVSLLGLPEEEDWILSGPYSDKTLMRNVLVYDLARDIGRYASRTRYVDLYINGDYRGIYVLMEKLKRDTERINISKADDSDVTGGYILKVDRPEGNFTHPGEYTTNNSFMSYYGSTLDSGSSDVNFLYGYPKVDDITQEQRDYISGYVMDFETSLASYNFTHPINGNRYEEYVDVDSFVDFMILNEITNNIDSYRLSTFMYKDAGGKLEMGPVWDFNLGFGNTGGSCGLDLPIGWSFNTNCSLATLFWWERLVEEPVFISRLQTRWSELRAGVFSDESVLSRIDSYVSELAGSVDKNFEKWDILGKYVWPVVIGKTYEEEVDFLKSWLSERMIWMDDAIAEMDPSDMPDPPVPTTATVSTPTGTVTSGTFSSFTKGRFVFISILVAGILLV